MQLIRLCQVCPVNVMLLPLILDSLVVVMAVNTPTDEFVREYDACETYAKVCVAIVKLAASGMDDLACAASATASLPLEAAKITSVTLALTV